MKIYLDVSCLNRPFDDQTQARVRLESTTVTLILDGIESGTWSEASSRMAEIEASAISDKTRRRRVLQLIPRDRMELTPPVFERARGLVQSGLSAADAVHVAAAEEGRAEVLLACDDRLVRRARRLGNDLQVRVVNPV